MTGGALMSMGSSREKNAVPPAGIPPTKLTVPVFPTMPVKKA
jgi:hypothetical protein